MNPLREQGHSVSSTSGRLGAGRRSWHRFVIIDASRDADAVAEDIAVEVLPRIRDAGLVESGACDGRCRAALQSGQSALRA